MNKRLSLIVLFSACITLLAACASSGPKRLDAGPPKNSVPFFDREAVEEIQTIAIPPFLGDIDGWRDAAFQKFLASKAAIIPLARTDQAARSIRKDLSSADTEERPELLARIGRSVSADAVINGIVLIRDERQELVLQLVSSRDRRLLWWQSLEFSVEGNRPDDAAKEAVLSGVLTPLVQSAGKKFRSAPGATEDRQDRKAKPGKKPDRTSPPSTAPDISPM